MMSSLRGGDDSIGDVGRESSANEFTVGIGVLVLSGSTDSLTVAVM